MRTQRFMIAIALAIAVSCLAVTARAADDSLSADAIQSAESAAAQNALADQYEAEAARLRAEAAKHEQMLRSYERKPTYHKTGQKGPAMSNHCLRLIEQYNQAADEAESLARQHRTVAAEMALAAGVEEVNAVQEKALAEQYTKEAAQLRQEADKHKAMKRAYESRVYRKGTGPGAGMTRHCDDLIAQYTAAADEAAALAKMHMELAGGK